MLFACSAAVLALQLICAALASVDAASGKAVVLQNFPAGTYGFDLVIAPCRSEECPVQVWLRQHGKVVDRFTLQVAAHTQQAKKETVDAVWGAEVGSKAWATGVETQYVSTLARKVTVAPGKTGLLVTQNFGFEHRKRGHVFLMPRNGKLTAAWSYEEGSGPTWSSTEVVAGQNKDTQDIIHFRAFGEPAEDKPEQLDVVRLRWDRPSSAFRETALPDRTTPLYVVHVGTFDTMQNARQARLKNAYCLGAYRVLDASRFAGVAGGKAVLARIYVRREAAEAAGRAVKACLPGASASTLRWTGS